MWSVAPISVMLLALVGLLIVAFATTRIAFLERRLRRTTVSAPSHRHFVRSNA
jgi:ABC-type transporter Mla subunit MlaD